jgi:hypothetical protein
LGVVWGETLADLTRGVGPEFARRALRRRLAGEARHLHKKQVLRARGAEAELPNENFFTPKVPM